MDIQVIAENLLYSINNTVDYIKEGDTDEALMELEDMTEIIRNTLWIRPERLVDDESEECAIGDHDIPDPFRPLNFHEDSPRRW